MVDTTLVYLSANADSVGILQKADGEPDNIVYIPFPMIATLYEAMCEVRDSVGG